MAVQISGNDITVPRDGSFTRNVTIGGTLTYEDVTNIDSVGLVTARTGIEIGARPGVAASISVDGNAIFSGITTATTIKSTTGIVTTLTSTTLNVDGGDATFTGASANIIFDKSDDALEFNDDAKATFGTGADTTLTHSGADFAITNTTGNLNILNNSAGAVQIRHGSETMIKAVSDGAVELYHDDSKKLETASGGVTVTGAVTATTFESSTFSKTPTNTPAFHAWSGTSQSVPISDSTETKIQFLNSETLDTDSAYDNSTSGTTANRFTVPSGKGGYYQVSAGLNFYADSNDMRGIIMYVKKNGAVVITQYGFIGSYFAGMRHLQCNLSGILQLAAADYIELYAWLDTNGNSGGYISNDGNGYRGNFFSAFKLII